MTTRSDPRAAVESSEPLGPSQQATRAKILDTASRLFYERGVHAVGVNEIAASSRASKLSLYRYFGSKENLVAAMLAEHSDRIHAWLERETEDAPAGPARVLSVFDLLLAWFAEPGYRGCAVVNTVADTRADPVVAAIARRHLARYRALLEARLAEIDCSDPPTLARQLLILIEGASVITTVEESGAGADARRVAERLLATAV